jgi:hypothetical protein
MNHTKTAAALRTGLLTAAGLLLACAAPAHADASDPYAAPLPAATPAGAAAPAAQPGDWLLLTVTRADAPAGATDGGTLLLCDPPRGHARAAAACAELDAARGDIGAIPQRKSLCPMIHAPVTAHARGTWRGRPVQYEETFPNACVMTARTGALFTPPDARA